MDVSKPHLLEQRGLMAMRRHQVREPAHLGRAHALTKNWSLLSETSTSARKTLGHCEQRMRRTWLFCKPICADTCRGYRVIADFGKRKGAPAVVGQRHQGLYSLRAALSLKFFKTLLHIHASQHCIMRGWCMLQQCEATTKKRLETPSPNQSTRCK